ncbi:MAG TPA: FecR domain-containing protein [Parasegetibacter sp.]
MRNYLDQYTLGTISPAEWEQLKKMLKDPAYAKQLEEYLDFKIQEGGADQDFSDLNELTEDIVTGVLQQIRTEKPTVISINPRFRWPRYAAAAVILIAGIATWSFLSKTKNTPPVLSDNIEAGREGAILTLADGSTLVLDSLQKGLLMHQPGSSVKLEDGQIVYASDELSVSPVAYNTMTTPRGREFGLVLPDGTKVWLNAASSVTYPTRFEGKERRVSITGEAYFEVARNETLPFIVNVGNNDTVQVLGTHFNINSYPEENKIVTTVLEGKVKVSSGSQLILTAGQQSVSVHGKPLELELTPDLDQVMAWRNGVFYFRSAGLKTVMMQIERWYDIDVVYQGNLPEMKISGKMDRGLSLTEILDFLDKMDVKYSRRGRTLIVQGN